MSVYHYIRQLAARIFSKKVSFCWKTIKNGFRLLHRVTKTHKDKIASQIQVSVWPSGLSLQISVLL